MRMGGVNQMTKWAVRKYGLLLVTGAISTFLLVNLTLHVGGGLNYHCSIECLEKLLMAPLPSLDKDVILHIRNNWLDPPAPRGTYKPPFPLETPPWSINGTWGEAYKFINNYFKHYEIPGTFVEVGARGSEFKSLTLWVEQQLGFRGLLIEPHREAYQTLRAAGRSAHSIQACATPSEGHRKDVLWIRGDDVSLPFALRELQKGSNRLLQYVTTEDRDLGTLVPVQCFNLGALVIAALKRITVDLLVISTHGGEMDIFSSIPQDIRLKMVVVVAPIVTGDEMEPLLKVAKRWGLTLIMDYYDMHMFVPDEVIVKE